MSLVIPDDYWLYCQEEGSLWPPAGWLVDDIEWPANGYSGHDVGLNNPSLQASPNVGPIPQGLWTFASAAAGPSHLGPVAIAITPVFGTVSFGRNGFFLHGDTVEDVLDHTRDASHGCLVFPRVVREAVLRSSCKNLVVVKNENTEP